MIAELQPWHLMRVVLNMRESDRAEFGTVIAEPDPQRWACRRALEEGLNFSVLTPAGKPVACFGFLNGTDPEMCNLWMIATDEWKPYVKSIKKTYDAVISAKLYRVVQAGIRTQRADSRRFIEWLGLESRGTLPHYLPNDEAIEMFSRVRST